MKRNVKVIDEHNIDRSANIVFALELDGSEYVVYWIERDEESNNLFVSKVLKNTDGTYNMMNIDDSDKKKDVSEIIKGLIFNAVSDQNDKMSGTTTTLADGKVVRFVSVLFNKEQNINVTKTYITTVKKEVTKVAETYYDIVLEEASVTEVFPSVAPVVETPAAPSVVQPQPVVATPATVVVQPTPVLIQPEVVAAQPVVAPTPVVPTPVEVVQAQPVMQTVPVAPQPVVVDPVAPAAVVQPTPVLIQPEVVVAQPVVTPAPVEVVQAAPVEVVSTPAAPSVVQPTPVPVVDTAPQGLVFNAAKEKNLNAALGEVASSTTIPVENIATVREFGVEEPVAQPAQVVVTQPAVETVQAAPVDTNPAANGNGGFANSKFFMVVAIAFFLASCIFLGYEVYNYFQLVQ